ASRHRLGAALSRPASASTRVRAAAPPALDVGSRLHGVRGEIVPCRPFATPEVPPPPRVVGRAQRGHARAPQLRGRRAAPGSRARRGRRRHRRPLRRIRGVTPARGAAGPTARAGAPARQGGRRMTDASGRCRIVHIALAAPLAAVPGDPDGAAVQLVFWLPALPPRRPAGTAPAAPPSAPGGAAVQLVFWLADLPLGRCEVTPDAVPLSVAAVAALASQAVAPTVGARLFAAGFEGAVPAMGGAAESGGDVAAVLACERPLDALRARWLRRGAGSGTLDAGAARDAIDATRTGTAGAPTVADVSVVVCTRDRPAALARCLESLRRAGGPRRGVLVVYN